MLVRCVKYTCMPQVFVRPSVCLSVCLSGVHTFSSWAQTLSLPRICPRVPLWAPVVGTQIDKPPWP